jgi:hypothetical protein
MDGSLPKKVRVNLTNLTSNHHMYGPVNTQPQTVLLATGGYNETQWWLRPKDASLHPPEHHTARYKGDKFQISAQYT